MIRQLASEFIFGFRKTCKMFTKKLGVHKTFKTADL